MIYYINLVNITYPFFVAMASESTLGVIVTAWCMNIAVVDEVTTDHHFHLYHIELCLSFISQTLFLENVHGKN